MLVQYRSNGMQREIKDSVANALIARKVVTPVYNTKVMVADVSTKELVNKQSEATKKRGRPKKNKE